MFELYWLVFANASSPIKRNTFQWESSESISWTHTGIFRDSGSLDCVIDCIGGGNMGILE